MTNKEDLERMKFINRDYPDKPSLSQIGQFLDERISSNGLPKGLAVSKDRIGNWVYSSLGKEEYTFAGVVSPSLVVSDAGKQLLLRNRGLLRDIHDGNLTANDEPVEGTESYVYRIALDTPSGPRDFALKYIFPIDEGYSYTHTSGIIAMRIMQQAQTEKPIPNIGYAVPLIATHDFTLAPFFYSGVSSQDITEYLIDPQFFIDHQNLSQEEQRLLHDVRKGNSPTENFSSALGKVFLEGRKILRSWVEQKILEDTELSNFGYYTGDTSLNQAVVSIPKFRKVVKKFQQNAGYPEFKQDVHSCLAMVELGVSAVEEPDLV